ncbi:MAG: DUF4043 family protein [Gammaproteobacteria bacterium]|nr:DUF4043 family protein [Gammaproteobacteria bacterium]
MANSTAATGLTAKQWDDKFFTEYFQSSVFAPEFGTSENSIIQVKQDLMKKRGDTLHFALVNALSGSGVTGSNTLVGNEEAMVSRSFPLTVTQRRNAVVVSDWDEQKSSIDLRNASRSVLMDWAHESTRDQVIAALASINGVAYGTATETQKDAWLVDNADRVLFGAAKSNNAANDHSACLAEIDNTADQLTPAMISLAKRIALTASPKVRPIRSESTGRRYFIMYANSLSFRDLKEDSTLIAAQRDVSLKMQNETLFKGGDLEWDGVIIKEVDDIGVLAGVGAGSIQVGPNYLCGAQALGYGIAKRWNTVTDDTDYEDKKGVAVREMGGIAKIIFGSGSADTDDTKDHGVVTVFAAAVADA